MEQHSMVHQVEVVHDGTPYTARYFVEDGVIHANLAGRHILRRLGDEAAADTVRTMFKGFLQHRARKLAASSSWADLDIEHPLLRKD